MDQLDVYYRALIDYRRQTLENRSCRALRAAIASADVENDKIVIKRMICTIKEDWVDAIEVGLVHVEKALKEERQFIRSNGEVIPIEKVKHVSRESVEHLAKHSNLITQCEDEDNLIPEKLYAVERLNDYAVYENRFLYMMLCYLRDFITIRYNDILDLSNRYEAELACSKTISAGKQKMTYTVSMHDIKRDDPYMKETNPEKDTINRIHLLLKTVIAFLGTPLMQEVSKVAMLKPPITKTNVLKMNNNFKGAVALYEFIMAYQGKGYEIEEQTTTLAPFRDALADELAEAGSLISFLVYEYGLDINKVLKTSYLREEERRKVEMIKQRADRIETLKRRLKNAEINIEEYTLTLEDQLRELSGQAERAERLADELASEKEKTAALTKEVEKLNNTIDNLHKYIEELKHQHFLEIERLKQEHEDEMHALIVKHENEIRELNELHEKEMQACIERHEQEIAELKNRHAAEIQRMKDAQEELVRQHESKLAQLKEQARVQLENQKKESDAVLTKVRNDLSLCTKELEESKAAYVALEEAQDELREELRIREARIKVLGGITEDYTDREHFNELEREYQAFERLYKTQWQKTKQAIKKKHLSISNLKPQKEKKGGKEE